jgi:diguanylate cyclase (GGDEF)-like protein
VKESSAAVAPVSIEQEELRGISRSVAEIEWLLLILVLLYYAFGGTAMEDQPAVVAAMVAYTVFVMGFRYARFFRQESRWKLAVETWAMTGFITWALWHTGGLESPLLNSYLLVIITAALALGKLTTLLELVLIAACLVFLGGHTSTAELLSLKYAGGMFAKFAPFVLVAYITTMFASDIRYGLNKAKRVSETDELTGALNRRGFAIVADRLFGQAVRYERAISLLAIDCDNLKQVNDAHGHKAGDKLLVALVMSILGQLRHTDVLARLGGDEFVVLLPETPAAGALDVAERIRAAVQANPIVLDAKLVSTTVSIGVAAFPADGHSLDLLLAAADRRLYEAKQGGRNRVTPAAQQAPAAAAPVEEMA